MHVLVQYNMYVPIYGWILYVLYVRLYSRKKYDDEILKSGKICTDSKNVILS